MKYLKLLFILLITLSLFSCNINGSSEEKNSTKVEEKTTKSSEKIWKDFKVKDDFGEYTGETYRGAIFKGFFSNSATLKSELTVKIVNYDGLHILDLFEYNSHKVSFDNRATGKLSVKRESGEIEEYGIMYLDKYGVIFTDEEDRDFNQVITNGENEKIICRISSADLSSLDKGSEYTFTIITTNVPSIKAGGE